MSKQTVTGVAEGHLLHKDFLVEYDPDERTWTVEREVPVEPTPEPGTAGTATVRGVKDVRVMRNDHNGGAWYSGRLADEWRLHRDEFVTNFVPDPKPGVIPDEVANAIAENWRSRVALVQQRAERAERDRDEAQAEVERLTGVIRKYDASDEAQVAQIAQLQDALRDGVSTPAVTTPGTETPAETPAPAAFVLPDREAFTAAVEDILGGPAQSEADQILALLAEHAVTPERLAPALEARYETPWVGRFIDDAAYVLHHLTGKAS